MSQLATKSKRQTVVLLRWVLIIAFSYLLILDASATHLQTCVIGLIVGALASNLVIGRIPREWTETQVFDFSIVLFDAAWVTCGLIWAPSVSGDLFLLYFLVIFVAAVGESLLSIVGSAALVSVVYGYTISTQSGSADFHLLRVPFLFVVALFYGYFVSEIRGRKSEVAEAQLRDKAKSELLAAVSHDLRSPLANAQSLLELAMESGDDGHIERDLLLRAQVNIQRVVSLVSNLLQTACIEAGQVRLHLAPAQVNDIVADALHMQSPAAGLKGLSLTAELDPHLPTVMVDAMQLGRVVGNLVDNAIKYTRQDGSVTVRTSCDEEALTISVLDTGPGMNEEQRKELFAPYRRVHIGGYTPGMGLGLNIVKRLTAAMEGSVRVDSVVGVGSTFQVRLPRREASETRRIQLPVPEPSAPTAPVLAAPAA
ncbi:MAG TPA: HAMP domain-containing sensor histidine kinase [Candidatus Acidoferrales bacterium]|nr:HAMP domain-containing sensor histidine kinase [Candidatus Acidoferrales bacterium]